MIDTATDTVTGTLTLPSSFGYFPTGAVVPSPTADIAYVTTSCACSGVNVGVIDTLHNVLLSPLTVSDSITSAAFTPDGSKAYLVGLKGIYEVQTSTGNITATIPGAYSSIAFKP